MTCPLVTCQRRTVVHRQRHLVFPERLVDGAGQLPDRLPLVHHDHRHPLWETVLQDREALPLALRRRRQVGKAEGTAHFVALRRFAWTSFMRDGQRRAAGLALFQFCRHR